MKKTKSITQKIMIKMYWKRNKCCAPKKKQPLKTKGC